jgi:hypothetical protein
MTMPESYTVPAGGKDIYRHFVIPIPVSERRYVKAVDFKPNSRSVHHAFLLLDRTGQSRKLDREDGQPGFGGMNPPQGAGGPPGQFLSWHPGKVLTVPGDMAWTLEPKTDLVLQLHMQATGKPEPVQSAVGFYFTDAPSSRTLSKLSLGTLEIDIPAGEESYRVQDSLVLPVDVQILAVLPHAHYLGKELKGFATLPDGTRKWLLSIKNWDFNWQDEYRFTAPLSLPKGSTLTMEYLYDNSTKNARNPNNPPRRVRYGVQTTDEMAELWIQLQLEGRNDLARIENVISKKVLQNNVAFNEYLLRQNPNDVKVRAHLGEMLLYSDRRQEAYDQLRRAIQAEPNYDEAHYILGVLFRLERQFGKARQEFETTLRLNPKHLKAHGNLGFVYAELGNAAEAESQFRIELETNPDDEECRNGLNELLQLRSKGATKR